MNCKEINPLSILEFKVKYPQFIDFEQAIDSIYSLEMGKMI